MVPKTLQGDADIAVVRWCQAGPWSVLIFKSWLVCDWMEKIDNLVGIYASKVAQGFSAFQRQSCFLSSNDQQVTLFFV